MNDSDIRRISAKPELAGDGIDTKWVLGRNCVYHDESLQRYRVSIKTPNGWKSYGHFNDLETATYIANVAILAEHCEDTYELFPGARSQDDDELEKWRRTAGNRALENAARVRFQQVKDRLDALRLQRQREEEERAKEARERVAQSMRDAAVRRQSEELQALKLAQARRARKASIDSVVQRPTPQLAKLLKELERSDPLYQVAMDELVRRYDERNRSDAT